MKKLFNTPIESKGNGDTDSDKARPPRREPRYRNQNRQGKHWTADLIIAPPRPANKPLTGLPPHIWGIPTAGTWWSATSKSWITPGTYSKVGSAYWIGDMLDNMTEAAAKELGYTKKTWYKGTEREQSTWSITDEKREEYITAGKWLGPRRVGDTVTIPEGTTEIAYRAFKEGEEVTRVELPESLHTIRNYAFAHCPNLRELDLPNNVERIDSDAFSGAAPNLVVNCANETQKELLTSIGFAGRIHVTTQYAP